MAVRARDVWAVAAALVSGALDEEGAPPERRPDPSGPSDADPSYPSEIFTLGEPAHIPTGVDWGHAVSSVTTRFFEERDPSCPPSVTLAKMGGVILAISGVTLCVLGIVGVATVWAFHAMFG